MKELNKKQKIILIIILLIIGGAIIYYVYGKDQTTNKSEEILPYEENETQEISEETTDEEKEQIIIYITGEVNKEGIYELPEGSRIADAIEEANRDNRRSLHRRNKSSIQTRRWNENKNSK